MDLTSEQSIALLQTSLLIKREPLSSPMREALGGMKAALSYAKEGKAYSLEDIISMAKIDLSDYVKAVLPSKRYDADTGEISQDIKDKANDELLHVLGDVLIPRAQQLLSAHGSAPIIEALRETFPDVNTHLNNGNITLSFADKEPDTRGIGDVLSEGKILVFKVPEKGTGRGEE